MSDPTDPGGVTGSHERGPRNNTRVGDSGSPVGSPLTIVLAIIAVAVGFLIFRSISDDGNAGGLGGGDTTVPAATDPSGNTVATTVAGQVTTPTPTSAPTRTGATVVVINAGEVSQSAAAMTTELTDLGYTAEPGVSDNDDEALATTVVYFAGPGAPEEVANAVASDLGGVAVQAAPSPLPINSEDSPGAATVFVLLGEDLSGKSLPLPSVPTPPSTPTTT